ncbi:hypothetical protein TNIN_270181 [Trichonephila inaurata madagascariensis]|uniref:Uncharacterized protein n=1 Tax=Trichonephila inaurata madagascariensis TaxID=2747483 RepID=A0A8X7BZ20_9ARAC|nr:hypothetical protein TNIN_270181 [Trichonephila inaurata madagascariensis]
MHLQYEQTESMMFLQQEQTKLAKEAEAKVPFAQKNADLARWIEDMEQVGSAISLSQMQIGTEIHIQQNQVVSNQCLKQEEVENTLRLEQGKEQSAQCLQQKGKLTTRTFQQGL